MQTDNASGLLPSVDWPARYRRLRGVPPIDVLALAERRLLDAQAHYAATRHVGAMQRVLGARRDVERACALADALADGDAGAAHEPEHLTQEHKPDRLDDAEVEL